MHLRSLFAALCAFLCGTTHCASAQTPGGGAQIIPVADIVFVVDRSGTIGGNEYLDELEGIAASIGTAIPATAAYRVAVVVFNDTAELALPFVDADHPMLPDLIVGIHTAFPAGDLTEVRTGLSLARTTFLQDPSDAIRKEVVLLTDDADECAYREAAGLRHAVNARISVGWLQNSQANCDSLSAVYDLSDYDVLVNENTQYQVRIANAQINPPFLGSPLPHLPSGMLSCIGTNPGPMEYAAFLEDALCPVRFPSGADSNNNSVPDTCEYTDCDGNGTADILDPDCDKDGIPDACELDCTGDGNPDPCDCNCNGILDTNEVNDCDWDGIPDDCEPDCDGDGIPDDCEDDCDWDGIPDDCEFDCDGDGVPDDCDSEPNCDPYNDDIPDNCESDCDNDGIPDDCDDDVDGDNILDIFDGEIGPCDGGTQYGGGIEPVGDTPCGSSVGK